MNKQTRYCRQNIFIPSYFISLGTTLYMLSWCYLLGVWDSVDEVDATSLCWWLSLPWSKQIMRDRLRDCTSIFVMRMVEILRVCVAPSWGRWLVGLFLSLSLSHHHAWWWNIVRYVCFSCLCLSATVRFMTWWRALLPTQFQGMMVWSRLVHLT